MRPETEWLQRRWGVNENALAVAGQLLQAEEQGSTALQHFHHLPDWGKALTQVDLARTTPEQVKQIHTPLVVCCNQTVEYLQSTRLFATEYAIRMRLAQAVRAAETPLTEQQQTILAELFQERAAGDLQRKAVELALRRNLCWITGGPGTGKTTTLARILVALHCSGHSQSAFYLAAPTGKAAQRMRTAVAESLKTLPSRFENLHEPLLKLANSCTTLHSLLRYNPARRACLLGQFPSGAVIVVDECSMIDVFMWRALLSAIPQDAKLILLGDPHQLESVGMGNVLAELVAMSSCEPFAALHIHLTQSWRFNDRKGIGDLAGALQQEDPEAVLTVLQQHRAPDPTDGLRWIDICADALSVDQFPRSTLLSLQAVATAETPELALAALDNICILTAHRGQIRSGAETVSRKIEAFLEQQAPVRNQPIIINRNDPETGLRNGTLGILSTDASNRRKAWFRNADGTLRSFSILRLPEHSPAWAITIHRSQGSEYREVMVLLPREESPLATRTLLYTAITRAKRTVNVVGDTAAIRKAASTEVRRLCLVSEPLCNTVA